MSKAIARIGRRRGAGGLRQRRARAELRRSKGVPGRQGPSGDDAGGPRRQAVGAASRRQGSRHVEVQEARSLSHLLLQRRRRQSVAGGRLDHDAGAGRSAEERHQVVHRRRRAGQGRQADLRHQRLRLERQLRRPYRFAQHDGGADAGDRGRLQEAAGRGVRSRRPDRLPGDVRQSDRRLRLGHPDGELHRLETAERRKGAGAAHSSGRRRPRDPMVGRQPHLQGEWRQRRRR